MLLNIIDSPDNYKRILRVVFERLPMTYISKPEDKDGIESFWAVVEEVSKTRGDCMRCLAAVQFENLKDVINNHDAQATDQNIFTPEEYFEKIIPLFEVISGYDTESIGITGEGFNIAESAWNFIGQSRSDAILKYSDYVKQIIDAICDSQYLVYQLVLAEDVIEKIIQECFTNKKTPVILHLMKRFFEKMKFNEDDNMDSELRKRIFHCIRRYCNAIDTLFDKNKSTERLMAQKIFTFIVRLYIVLIEEGNIYDFEEFFDSSVVLYHDDSIYNSNVSPMLPALCIMVN